MEVIDNVIQAYEAVKLNDVSKGIIALCTFVAIIIVIQKFVTAWKEAFSEGDRPADMKQFFKLFYIYIYVFAIIMAAPFAFTIVETALGNIQNELIEHYQEDVDLSIDEAIATFTRDYIEEVNRRSNWVGKQIDEVIALPFNMGLLAHFTQIYHLYNLLIYNILRRNLQLFITEFCIFSPCIIFISNKNSDKSIEILHISPKYITSVDNLMIHIFSSTFNFLYSFTPSDRLESKS